MTEPGRRRRTTSRHRRRPTAARDARARAGRHRVRTPAPPSHRRTRRRPARRRSPPTRRGLGRDDRRRRLRRPPCWPAARTLRDRRTSTVTPASASWSTTPPTPAERLNVADTVKVQWQAYLGAGRLLLSDMGRVLMTRRRRHQRPPRRAVRHDQPPAERRSRYGDGTPRGPTRPHATCSLSAAAKHGLGRRRPRRRASTSSRRRRGRRRRRARARRPPPGPGVVSSCGPRSTCS